MGLMSKSAFVTLVGGMDDIFTEVRGATTAMNAALAALGFSFYTEVGTGNDPDIEIPMLDSAYNVDLLCSTGFTASTTLKAMTALKNLLTGFEAHLARISTGVLADRTLEGFLIQQAVTEIATLTLVEDIWYTLKSTHLQARAVPKDSQVTMWTHVYADLNETWNGTDGSKLFASSSYLPRGAAWGTSSFENFAAVPLTVTKTGVDAITADITVTGINENGQLATVLFEDVELVGTTEKALDTDYLFADITAVTIDVTLSADVTFVFKNALL